MISKKSYDVADCMLDCREATPPPRPELVRYQQMFVSDDPVCASKELGHFITGAATPPLEEGSAEADPQYAAVIFNIFP